MSRDGYLPDGVNESDIPGNRPGDNHHPECYLHEDQPERCVCDRPMEGHPQDTRSLTDCDGITLNKNPECSCPDEAELAAEAAEAKAGAREDR